MKRRQKALRGKQFVRHESHQEGRKHRSHGRGAGGETNLLAGKVQLLAQPGSQSDVPCSPNEILEEHHDRQSDLHLQTHAITLPGGVNLALSSEEQLWRYRKSEVHRLTQAFSA